MSKKVETKDYGTVEIRTAVFDLDGTTLQEGIEIKGDDIELTEIVGYYDIEVITPNEVNDLLGDKYKQVRGTQRLHNKKKKK